jgi:BTB/POZ domain
MKFRMELDHWFTFHFRDVIYVDIGEILANKVLLSLASEVFRVQFFGKMQQTHTVRKMHCNQFKKVKT